VITVYQTDIKNLSGKILSLCEVQMRRTATCKYRALLKRQEGAVFYSPLHYISDYQPTITSKDVPT
jgi:hypothetical protein